MVQEHQLGEFGAPRRWLLGLPWPTPYLNAILTKQVHQCTRDLRD